MDIVHNMSVTYENQSIMIINNFDCDFCEINNRSQIASHREINLTTLLDLFMNHILPDLLPKYN